MEPKDFSLLEQAYKNVYAEGAEEYSGGQHPSKSPNKADRDRYETQRRRAEAPKGVGVPDKSVGYGQLKQDVDMFDLVKGHLMSEGYADSEKAALAIMANMSEEWRESIVEGIIGQTADNIARTAGTVVGTAQRAARELPGYLLQKAKNVKGTFDTARERADLNIPPNVTRSKSSSGTSKQTASGYAKMGGDPQHMGRDLPPSKGGTSKLVVPPNVKRYAGGG